MSVKRDGQLGGQLRDKLGRKLLLYDQFVCLAPVIPAAPAADLRQSLLQLDSMTPLHLGERHQLFELCFIEFRQQSEVIVSQLAEGVSVRPESMLRQP